MKSILTALALLVVSPCFAQSIALLTDSLLIKYDFLDGYQLDAPVSAAAKGLRTDRDFYQRSIHVLRPDSLVSHDPYDYARKYKKAVCNNSWMSSSSSFSAEYLLGCVGSDTVMLLTDEYFKEEFVIPNNRTAAFNVAQGANNDEIWLGLDSGLAVVDRSNLNFYSLQQDSGSTKFRYGQNILFSGAYVYHLDFDRELLLQLDNQTAQVIREVSIPNCKKIVMDFSVGWGGPHVERVAVQIDSNVVQLYSADSLKLIDNFIFSSEITQIRGSWYGGTYVLLGKEGKLANIYSWAQGYYTNVPLAKDFLIFQTYNALKEQIQQESWVYPNPLSGNILNLDLNLEQAETLQIFNTNGQLVYSSKVAPQHEGVELHIPSLSPALYFIHLNGKTAPLIIE